MNPPLIPSNIQNIISTETTAINYRWQLLFVNSRRKQKKKLINNSIILTDNYRILNMSVTYGRKNYRRHCSHKKPGFWLFMAAVRFVSLLKHLSSLLVTIPITIVKNQEHQSRTIPRFSRLFIGKPLPNH